MGRFNAGIIAIVGWLIRNCAEAVRRLSLEGVQRSLHSRLLASPLLLHVGISTVAYHCKGHSSRGTASRWKHFSRLESIGRLRVDSMWRIEKAYKMWHDMFPLLSRRDPSPPCLPEPTHPFNFKTLSEPTHSFQF